MINTNEIKYTKEVLIKEKNYRKHSHTAGGN